MNTRRSVGFGAIVVTLLSACAGGGAQRSSVNDAAIANMNLGAGYLQQGNNTLAIERLQRALAIDPDLVEAHATIAIAYDQIGNVQDAEIHYRRATQLDPDNGAAANSYAVFLCNRQNRWADAAPFFRLAAADTSYRTPEVALTNAGVCALTAGETEAAAEMFRAALVRNATYPNALLSMMELTHRGGNSLQARAFVQRYLAAHQPTAPVLWLCVQIERELNDAAAADRCAAQLRGGFRGSTEVEQLEELTRRNGR